MTWTALDCGVLLADAWDPFGGFVCGLEPGHAGPHRSRPRKRRAVLEWEALEEP